MTYVVNDACIKCKFMDCVEVCPVDCFYEGDNMLVIHPVSALSAGCVNLSAQLRLFTLTLTTYRKIRSEPKIFEIWPNITRKGDRLLTPKTGATRKINLRTISVRRPGRVLNLDKGLGIFTRCDLWSSLQNMASVVQSWIFNIWVIGSCSLNYLKCCYCSEFYAILRC